VCGQREISVFFFKIRGAAALFFKKMRGGKGYDFFAREDRFRFFFVFFLILENYPLVNIFSPSLLWLEVHLYRKSLHVLFKEILQ
jgi:hypothetical protein